MIQYNEHGHLNETIMQKMKNDFLSYDDKMQALAHIAMCNKCCESYMQSVENVVPKEQTTPLAAQIKTAVMQKKRGRIMLFYELKIGFAVAASLFFVLCLPVQNYGDPYTQMEQNWSRSVSQTVTNLQEKIDILSDKLTTGGTFFETTQE